MCSGAIPVTSRYSSSVLPFLTHGFDLGPDMALSPVEGQFKAQYYRDWIDQHWLPAVIAAASRPVEELREMRARMKDQIQKQYSWVNSADILESMIS